MTRAGSHRGHLEGVVCASVVQVVTHAGNKQGKDLHVPGWEETQEKEVSHCCLPTLPKEGQLDETSRIRGIAQWLSI